MDEIKQPLDKETVDFMKLEYKMLFDTRDRQTQIGQTYVNLFIAIASGIVALLSIISKIPGGPDFIRFSIGILAIFIPLGIVSVIRITKRDISITKCTRGLNRIRWYFVENEPDIRKYLIYPPNDDKPSYTKHGLERICLRTLVYLVNSYAIATLTYLLVVSFSNNNIQVWVMVVISVLVFFLSILFHEYILVHQLLLKAAKEKENVLFTASNAEKDSVDKDDVKFKIFGFVLIFLCCIVLYQFYSFNN